MSNTFNERIFDEIMQDILASLNKQNKFTSITLNDIENIINDMLNDNNMLKKYTRDNIVKYTTLLKHEINKNKFDMPYLNSRIEKIKEQHKMKLILNNEKQRKRNPFRNINIDFLIKNISSSVMNLSRDLVLFFFTICIVAHLRIRTFIKSCHLYPSNPNRFPYVFFDETKKEQKRILSIINTQNDIDTEPVFDNVKLFYDQNARPSNAKNMRMNDVCGKEENDSNNTDLIEAAAKILFGESENNQNIQQRYSATVEKIVQQLTGTTYAEKVEKINISSKTFMEEHREKCKDELSVYSLVTYIMYYNTLKNRESVGYLHNSLFKYLTSSDSKPKFGVFVILLYSIFKNNVMIAERFVNNVLDYYSNRYDGGGKLHTLFTGILSSVLTPFVTFSLLLMIIMYPLSIFNCMKSYFNYVGLTNQLSTKLVCYSGIVYSVIALVLYSAGVLTAIFPEFLAYMMRELKYMTNPYKKSPRTAKGKGSDKADEYETKKGKGSDKEQQNETRRGSKKQNKSSVKKGKGSKEGFKGEKGCSGGGLLEIFSIANLVEKILLFILGFILLMPIVMPFVCAFMSSFGIASALSFDSLKFISLNMCSVKQYSFIIKLLVAVILIHQAFNRFSYGAARNKWITISIYLFALLVYICAEMFAKPTNKYFDNLTCDK